MYTIIVIIILAGIVIGLTLNTPETANRARFASDISEVQHVVKAKLAENYNQYLTNPNDIDLNAGFTRVSVIGAPESFDREVKIYKKEQFLNIGKGLIEYENNIVYGGNVVAEKGKWDYANVWNQVPGENPILKWQ